MLLDLVRRRVPDIPVVFVDTGYHFPKTLGFLERISADWDLDLVVAAPDTGVAEHEALLGTLHRTDSDRCCALRKTTPAHIALDGHDVWFAAMRRSQSAVRSGVDWSEETTLVTGASITKVHPLLDWSWADVESYAERHGIPRHPLYGAGYTSIGCEPCTDPTFGAGDDRSGRWSTIDWKTECGLHTSDAPTNGRRRGEGP